MRAFGEYRYGVLANCLNQTALRRLGLRPPVQVHLRRVGHTDLGDEAWIDDQEIEEDIAAAELIRFEQDEIDDHQTWRDADLEEESDIVGRYLDAQDINPHADPIVALLDGSAPRDIRFRGVEWGYLLISEGSQRLWHPWWWAGA